MHDGVLIRNHTERSMLEEVASWARGTELDFKLTKSREPGLYCFRLHADEGNLLVTMELTPDEALCLSAT